MFRHRLLRGMLVLSVLGATLVGTQATQTPEALAADSGEPSCRRTGGYITCLVIHYEPDVNCNWNVYTAYAYIARDDGRPIKGTVYSNLWKNVKYKEEQWGPYSVDEPSGELTIYYWRNARHVFPARTRFHTTWSLFPDKAHPIIWTPTGDSCLDV